MSWKFRNNTVKHLPEKAVILLPKVRKQKNPIALLIGVFQVARAGNDPATS